MKQIISSREAYDKINAIQNDVIAQIKEYGEVIDFNDQSFSDMSGNYIYGIVRDKVYMSEDFLGNDHYPLSELD